MNEQQLNWARELLADLSNLDGLPGREGPVRKRLIESVAPHVDEYRVDNLGNLITIKHGAQDAPVVMVAAHMDEVGLMITHIRDDGLLSFRPLGGLDDRVLLTKVVRIGKDQVPGVIGSKPVHLQDRSERKEIMKVKDLTIDIGASSKDEAEELVSPGDVAAFDTQFETGQQRLKGKAFDDRAGCAVLAQALRHDYQDITLYGVFTVQEELGVRGATVAAYDVDPDIAIALEGTTCADIPGSEDHEQSTRLDGGPAITFMDRTSIANPRLVKHIIATAEEASIPWQWRRTTMGGTDAGPMSLSREGAWAAGISVPCRYIHSPVCMCSSADFDHTVELVTRVLQSVHQLGGNV